LMYALGLAGEAGEVVELVKKRIFHGKVIPDKEIFAERGDILWYLAGICDLLGTNIRHVAVGNLIKLYERYPDIYPDPDSVEVEL